MTDLVLVTGATGFIAQHCIVELLEAGYRVRGTVRRGRAWERTRKSLRDRTTPVAQRSLDRLEIVIADLTANSGWNEAVAGCRYVLHIASPNPATPPSRVDELVEPARDGALRVLRASQAAGVERAVMTSSITAILDGVDRRGRVFTESDWSDPDGKGIGAYEKSKILAEQAAWDYVDDLSHERRLELAVVNPGLALGPIMGGTVSNSGRVIQVLMERAFPAVPDVHFAIVDVRDVATAHLAAMTHPDAAGERFICAAEDVSMRYVARVLAATFASQGFNIPTRDLPNPVFRVAARFDRSLRVAAKNLGRPEAIDNAKITRVLGWSHRPLDETIVEAAESMISAGIVRPP